MSADYPEIEKLKQYVKDNEILVEVLGEAEKHYTFWVELTINKRSWKLYVDDEYNDLNAEKPVIALFLILSSLQEYQDSSDYLDWCRISELEPSDSWLEYYRSLDEIVKQIESEIGIIDPLISQFDYSLNTGVIKALRAL